jgi:hypothetical protein
MPSPGPAQTLWMTATRPDFGSTDGSTRLHGLGAAKSAGSFPPAASTLQMPDPPMSVVPSYQYSPYP